MLYLNTSHDGYYEKYGWQRIKDGYFFNGSKVRIYKRQVASESMKAAVGLRPDSGSQSRHRIKI